jgi:hypothetical protein
MDSKKGSQMVYIIRVRKISIFSSLTNHCGLKDFMNRQAFNDEIFNNENTQKKTKKKTKKNSGTKQQRQKQRIEKENERCQQQGDPLLLGQPPRPHCVPQGQKIAVFLTHLGFF